MPGPIAPAIPYEVPRRNPNEKSPRARLMSARGQHDLANVQARLQEAVGIRGALEWERLGNDRPEPPDGQLLQQQVHRLFEADGSLPTNGRD